MLFFFELDGDNLSLFDHYPPAASSTFHVDPFGITPSQTIRETNTPINMFSSNLMNTTATTTTNNFFIQSLPQLIPTPVKTPTSQSPLPIKKLSLNPPKNKNETMNDLLDFGDPSPPPPESPKFDPYA